MTTRQIKAHFRGGVFVPEEAIELEDGCEATVEINDQTSALRPGLLGIVDKVNELHQSMPEDAWDDVPTDLAKNKKHHLHGHPREEDE